MAQARERALAFVKTHALLIAVSIAAALPLVLVRYPPLQDFPVHVATIRVLHDFHDPSFGFDREFDITLGRTQYAGFYGFGHLLAFLLGPRGAAIALVVFYLVGTILALRALLLALGRDERLCLAVVPVLYGATFAIGLMPFLCAFPVTIAGVAALVRCNVEPTPKRHGIVAAVALGLFFIHVVHLAIFFLAAFLFFPWRGARRTQLKTFVTFLPAGGALVWWLFSTNVGRRVLELGKEYGTTNRPRLDGALLDVVPWMSDAYPDMTDEITFGVLLVALAITVVLAHRTRTETPFAVRFYWVLPLVLFLLYLSGERARGWIWPLGQRYMLPAFIFAIPLLSVPKPEKERRVATTALAFAAFATIANVTMHFFRFQSEVGDFPQALAQIEPRKRVASLVYKSHARTSRFSPFLHFGSYVQAEKGGVVNFTFAGYDQWPFDFKRGRYPIYDGPATPRWDFFPAYTAETQPLGDYFDYVLARDRGKAPEPEGFRRKWRGDRWEVFERDTKRE